MSDKPHHPADRLFKAVFKNADNVRELLAAKLPAELLSILDLNTIRITDASYVDERLSEDFSDVVMLCDTQTGETVAIPFILEHKSYLPAHPPFQVMHYQDRVWQQQIRDSTLVLTPVVPVMFYHGQEEWIVKPWSAYLKGWQEVFQPFTPPGGYIFIDLSGMPDEEITAFRSGFLKTALLLMKHRLEREFLLENLRVIINFVESDSTDVQATVEYLKIVLRYLQGLRVVKWEEVRKQLQPLTLTNSVMNIWEEIKMEAWEEGKEEGRMEGRMEGMETESFAIISSLIKHLPEANDETIANLTSKPVEWVARVRREMNA